MTTDPNNEAGRSESGFGQPSQDDVFAASPPFASAGDGFAEVPGASGAPTSPLAPHLPPAPQGLQQGDVTCHQLLANLGFYLDGELDVTSNAAVQRHLGTCGACQTAQAFQMQFRSTLAAKAFDPVPDDVRDRITKALGF